MTVLAERIRQARKRVGMSQQELADKLGCVTVHTVRNWEAGAATSRHRYPTMQTFMRLCITLNVSADELLGLRRTGSAMVLEGTEGQPS